MESTISIQAASLQVEKCIQQDAFLPSLFTKMKILPEMEPTFSGLGTEDYARFAGLPPALKEIALIKTKGKMPLPRQVLRHFNDPHMLSSMGLFTEIKRAWMTIDNIFYIWTYDDGEDVAYYDKLRDVILCVELIRPNYACLDMPTDYLLIVVTPANIVALGVVLIREPRTGTTKIHLVSGPVFTASTNGLIITTIDSTSSGRLFLGSREGNLLEVFYGPEKCKFKAVSLPSSIFSYLIPSFLYALFGVEEAIQQISIDNSRNILYVLTDKGTIGMYDLGKYDNELYGISKISQTSLLAESLKILYVKKLFEHIVNISAVEACESALINLVAVSENGIRFYFRVVKFPNLEENARPRTLTLVHIRLPPGHGPSLVASPKNVQAATYRNSNLMLATTTAKGNMLWCITTDMFPVDSWFPEGYTTIPLDGPALVIAEVRHGVKLLEQAPLVERPTVIYQHLELPREFVVLTLQGVYILKKLRPLDILRQLLLNCHGPEHVAVRTFFWCQKEEQASVMSLILACMESVQDVDVAAMATRTFFKFAGRTKLALRCPLYDSSSSSSDSFSPNATSTPFISPSMDFPSSSKLNRLIYSNQFVFSTKHTALYLYLGRTLLLLWNIRCVKGFRCNKIAYLTSSINSEDCTLILCHLNSLRCFLEQNTYLVMSTLAAQPWSATHQHTPTTSRRKPTLADAKIEENQSLKAFKVFVNHCCQVLGLWKILCDHEFQEIVRFLSPSLQERLSEIEFKDLICHDQKMCDELCKALVLSYTKRNERLDAIVSKLTEVYPHLYKNEDLISANITKILNMAGYTETVVQRAELISSALQLCKSIAPHMNLRDLCHQFAFLKEYRAVIELCITYADRVDPNKRAYYYYHTDSDDKYDQQHYDKRMVVYKEITLLMDNLNASDTLIRAPPCSETPLLQALEQDRLEKIRPIINEILMAQDELLHLTVYKWMLANEMYDDIVKITKPDLEKFLIEVSEHFQANIVVTNLLWKYYENKGDLKSAAKTLAELAHKDNVKLTLQERMEYLSNAIMYMPSSTGSKDRDQQFLQNLKDELDIAKLQVEVLNAVNKIRPVTEMVNTSVTALNSKLYSLTELFENFTDDFQLWECKLAMIQCANYIDEELVVHIWHQIIKKELDGSSGSNNEKLQAVLGKTIDVLHRFKNSPNCTPLVDIIEALEMTSAKLEASEYLVPYEIVSEMPMISVVSAYKTLIFFKISADLWSGGKGIHLMRSFAELTNHFLTQVDMYGDPLRTEIKLDCQDAISKLLQFLDGKAGVEQLIRVLQTLQDQLETC